MIRKLRSAAFFSAPLIAFNGAIPVYLQGKANLQEATITGLFICGIILHNWLINILLVVKLGSVKNWQRYLLSFLIILGTSALLQQAAIRIFALNFFPVNRQDFPIVTSTFLNSIVWVILELVRSTEQKKEAQKMIAQLRIENLEAQKQSLARQMQPHFFFNALSTLKSLIAENPSDAERYTVKLSHFLRYSFSHQSADVMTLQQELDFTLTYIELQSIRFAGGFTYEIDIPKEVLPYHLPIFALQTLVENIFKHNYLGKEHPLHFTISYQHERLRVWNEKTGPRLTERNQTGLHNLNERYELINGSQISIEDYEKEFSVTIPLLVV